ncbi:MAG: hypothetical protein WAU32_07190 [Thermoanaerobaculia bacterium]
MLPKALSQYLGRHAEPEASLADVIDGAFGHVLVVPAYGERESLFETLGSVPRGPRGETLIVVVLNAREDSPQAIHEANAAARERLKAEAKAARELPGDHPAVDLAYPNGRALLVDRSQPGRFLPEGQGVGLARKIGNDVALRLSAAGRLAAGWIHNTDADAVLPNDYFDQAEPLGGDDLAAAIYFFEHRFAEDEALALAARLYEMSLRYYVLGLAWAGSPYAYEAMGSCIAVRPAAYAAVRGFPPKNAAEDFYILNKLAKVGAIARLGGTPVSLDGRISERVPFGTGKALSRLTSKAKALAGFRLYHPAVFAHLAAWLRALSAIAASGGTLDAALSELPSGNPFFRTELLLESLERMKAFAAVRQAIERSKGDPRTMLRHFHTWFDAFRTLKLVHALRDGGLPSIGWREALAEAPFTGVSSWTVEDPEPLRRTLAAAELRLSETPAGVPAILGA